MGEKKKKGNAISNQKFNQSVFEMDLNTEMQHLTKCVNLVTKMNRIEIDEDEKKRKTQIMVVLELIEVNIEAQENTIPVTRHGVKKPTVFDKVKCSESERIEMLMMKKEGEEEVVDEILILEEIE